MRKTDIRSRAVEAGIFLAGYTVSSLVALLALGLGRLHQHGETIVTYSVLFGMLEVLKILLAGKILRVALFFANAFAGYYLMAFADMIKRGGSMHDIAPLGPGTYELLLLLGIMLSAVGYALLLMRCLWLRRMKPERNQRTAR